MNKIITTFLRKYKYMILVLYFPIYMLWFSWLERRDLSHFTIIHCKLDDMIPFSELFAIPYFLWFLYVAVSLLFLFLQSEHMSDFYRCSAVLMLGMTTCLIIYTIFPNAQPLRPESFPRDNFLTGIVAGLYQATLRRTSARAFTCTTPLRSTWHCHRATHCGNTRASAPVRLCCAS